MLLPFAPFAAVTVVHLASLLATNQAWSSLTKLLLMPALLVALLWLVLGVLRQPVSRLLVLASLGVLFSWAGDAFIGASFLLGLVCFAFAHVAYLLLFVLVIRERRLSLWVLAFVVWWTGIVLVLLPWVDALLIPVMIYGVLIVGLAAVSFSTNRFVVVGAVAFLISDTLLALKTFVPGWDFYPISFIIMTFYLVGQGLIIYGTVHRARSLTPAASPAEA